jgi:mRNA-degrading endonuclease RelE of RelBE toxin-antitoxin system
LDVQYRQSFLKDLKKLKGQPVYDRIFELAFTALPEADSLSDITNVKAMKGHPNRYRIRVGNYRVGIEVHDNNVEVMRVLHRREFYRYFP